MTLCHLLSITVQNLFYSPDSVQFVLSSIYILYFFMFFVNSKFAPSLFSSTRFSDRENRDSELFFDYLMVNFWLNCI